MKKWIKETNNRLHLGTQVDVKSYKVEDAKRLGADRCYGIRVYVKNENRYISIPYSKLDEGMWDPRVWETKLDKTKLPKKYWKYQLVVYSVRSAEQKIEDANAGGLFSVAKDLTGREDWKALGAKLRRNRLSI